MPDIELSGGRLDGWRVVVPRWYEFFYVPKQPASAVIALSKRDVQELEIQHEVLAFKRTKRVTEDGALIYVMVDP